MGASALSDVTRRALVLGSALALSGCERVASELPGGWVGTSPERGHLLRDRSGPQQVPGRVHQVETVILGAGVAGLAAARALRLRGREDFVMLELEDQAGGNSRATTLAGLPCPIGAHYLPLPGEDAVDVQDLLEELGLRRRVAGRWEYDERHLCHSPQERLFWRGQWHEGLLPVQGVGTRTLSQYRRFSEAVERARTAARFPMPSALQVPAALHREWDALTFRQWLANQALDDELLLAYLDYACRDDYGAGLGSVSAWAGIHYFASRHGFAVPGDAAHEREGLLTWPEGNAWLTRQLAAPLGERLKTGYLVLRVAQGRSGVEVDALNFATQGLERWHARHAIMALPVHVATRLLEATPQPLQRLATRLQQAPWLVANLHLRAPLNDRPGAPPSWDNVIHGSQGLGYVDAGHQNLSPMPGPTVLTCYRALTGADGDARRARQDVLQRPWQHWRDLILDELAVPHPDVRSKATQMLVTRHGHAMAIPTPGTLALLRPSRVERGQHPFSHGRLHFAHSDWAGYSVFEEAFALGHSAGSWLPRS